MRTNEKTPPEGVRCQLEQRGVRRQDACHPSQCPECSWNLDNQKKEGEDSGDEVSQKTGGGRSVSMDW